MPAKIKNLPEEDIKQMYINGATCTKIGEIFGVTHKVIVRILKENEIHVRKSHRRCKYYMIKCKTCGKFFEVPTWRKKRNPTYCSKKCMAEDYKDRLLGKNNPFYNKKHSEKSLKKAVETRRKMWEDSVFKKMHSEKTSKGVKQKMKGGWKPVSLQQPCIVEKRLEALRTPSHRKKTSERFKKLWKTEDFVRKQMKARNVRPNKCEKKLEKIMEDNDLPFKYVGDGKLIIDGKCPDFVWEEKKKLIEFFGEYWHTEDEIPKRKKIFRDEGYSTLIIWGKELKDPTNIINKIKKFMKQS